MKQIPKPQQGEYAPYTILYIGLVPAAGFVLKHLHDNLGTHQFIRALPKL